MPNVPLPHKYNIYIYRSKAKLCSVFAYQTKQKRKRYEQSSLYPLLLRYVKNTCLKILITMDKVSVYYFRSVKFSAQLNCVEQIVPWTSALLRGLQKMAASKPISWTYIIITSLISLNNNFGTLLALVLGCFPLDIQPYRTMSDYSIMIIALPITSTHR